MVFLTRYDHLLRVAARLGKVEAGSFMADVTIHEVLSLAGPVLAYTKDEEAARTLLPSGFEWIDITPTAGWIYAPCRRAGVGDDGLPFPHHGQWCRTIPLSLCGGVLRAWAMLERQAG